MLKKFLTVLTAFLLALNAVLPLPVSASSEISEEARICRDLEILKGDTGVVDSTYLQKQPNRMQAAIMFLRLKGLEEEALSYKGQRNFKDAGVIVWDKGRNVLSYLKEHPELGWIGDGTNFMPLSPIDSKAYYKVLLETLGYRQKIDGEGDFAWEEVLKFAESKGLKKVAGDRNFTVNSLAVATVEALRTPVKNSRIKLVQYLVNNGTINKYDAETLGLYREAIDSEVKSVRAISNSKAEVVFEDTVDESIVLQQDMYDFGKLDIKDISLKNDCAVILDTGAMSENTTYTVTINDKNYSFKGLKRDNTAPRLISVECKDTDLLELVFDRVLDNHTAQDDDTYAIDGADVKSASLDATNTKVRLVTGGIESNKSYEIKIRNIKNGDGVNTKLITKRFTGRKDTTAPKLSNLTVLNNIRLLAEFTDKNGLNKKVAEDIDNYEITSSSGDLEIVSATAKDRDNDGLWDAVELETESQDSGKSYTLKIKDLCDDSILKNRITREIKKEFRGKSKDKTGPVVAHNPKVITNTLIEVVFEDSNALDMESACDFSNYELYDDLEIEDIRIKNPDDLYSTAGRTVLITTSEMEKNQSYTLIISGVCDEFGNEMKSSGTKKYRFRGAAEDNTPPYIVYVECINSRTIELSFDDRLDEASAENIMNYRIDGLALVTKAVLQEDEKTVTLTVSSLSSDRNHKILLNNIKDLSGNALSNVSVSVLYNGDIYDTDPPEVDYIDAVNEDEIWVTFNEEIYAENARLETKSGPDFNQVGSVLEDGVTIVMRAESSMQDREYEVDDLTGVWDIRNNPYRVESGLEFYGSDVKNDPPEVDYWDQIDVRTFRVVFTEPVLSIEGEEVSGIDSPGGWSAKLNPEEEDTNEAYSTIDYTYNEAIPADKEFEFDFTSMVTDYAGKPAFDENDDHEKDYAHATILESYLEDEEEPYIDYVEAITRTKVQVVFNEAIERPGSYRIYYWDDGGDRENIDTLPAEVDSKEKNRVNIYTKDEMSSEYVYTLVPVSAAADIAGNRLDIDDLEIDFEGSDIVVKDYIQGVENLSAYTFKVSKSSRIYDVKSVKEIDPDGNAIDVNLLSDEERINDNTCKVTVSKPLLQDVRYEVDVDGLKYKFYGSVKNNDIELDVYELEITYDDMDFDRHYVEVKEADGTRLNVRGENGCFVIEDNIRDGELLYIYVRRVIEDPRESEGVILYGTRIKVEGMPEASSSKEITSYKIVSLDPDVVGDIDQSTGKISLLVPYGTKTESLVAAFESSDGAIVKVGSKIQESGKTENDFSDTITYTVIAEDGSKATYTAEVKVAESVPEKKIKIFEFRELKPEVKGEINEDKHEIVLEVPYNANTASLIPYIETSEGTGVSPSSGTPNDFTKEQIYTVTARDGSKQDYAVKVTRRKNSEKLIKSYTVKINDIAVAGTIDHNEGTISLVVPYNSDVSKLVPEITVSDNAVVNPDSGQEINFSNGVVIPHIVTAEDGSTKEYKASVSFAKNTEKAFLEFGFLNPKAVGKIIEADHTIGVKVPFGTDATNLAGLAAVFKCSDNARVEVGGKEQVSGQTVQNFTNPVEYCVYAQDGSNQKYTVTVTVAGEAEKEITEFILTAPNFSAKGLIDDKAVPRTIKLEVPAGTEIKNMIANFAFIGKSVKIVERLKVEEAEKVIETEQISGVTSNDFTAPVVYTVTAFDGSTLEYTVYVTVKQ